MKTLSKICLACFGASIPMACGGEGNIDTRSSTAASQARSESRSLERLAALRAVQHAAGIEYEVVPSGASKIAHNPAKHLALRYEATGLSIAHETPDGADAWHASLSFEGIGRGGAAGKRGVVDFTSAGKRVEFRREGELREWYENGPLGVEQGFVLERPPAGERGNVELLIAVNGDLAAEPQDAGLTARLVDHDGNTALEVSDLFVTDANGRLLPSKLEVRSARLVLSFDDRAAAYPVEVDPLVSTSQGKLLPNTNSSGSTAGLAVAVSGDRIALGAPYDGSTSYKGGSVYVYRRSGSSWVQEQKIEGPATSGLFGWSVGLSGTSLAIGAIQESSSDGAAYVYTRSATTWTQQQRIQGTIMDGQFGNSVSISGDYMIAGAPSYNTTAPVRGGGAFLYHRASGVWSLVTSVTESLDGQRLGAGVAVDGTTSVIGSPWSDVAGDNAGQVFIKLLSGTTWTNQLTYNSASAGDQLGFSVDVSGNTAVFGAPGDDDGNTDAGTARVFVRSGSTWGSERILRPSDPVAGARFGTSVAISGDTIVVGTAGDGGSVGFAYVFRRSGTNWVQDLKLTPSPVPTNTMFGRAVDINLGTVIVGDAHDNDNGQYAGAGWAYLVKLSNGSACTSASACMSGFCVDGVCCNAACGAGATTDCQACSTAKGAPSNGTCANLPATTTCRAAQSVCDIAEKCTGTSSACPADAVVPANPIVQCRASTNLLCDPAENCDGVNPTCPADLKNFPFPCP